ncbi:MAG: hypothetical protein WBF34_39205, partial [Streptosporangiaceae bacterium]
MSTDGFTVTGCYGMVVATDGSVTILADLRRRWPAGLAGIAAVKVRARLRCCGVGVASGMPSARWLWCRCQVAARCIAGSACSCVAAATAQA